MAFSGVRAGSVAGVLALIASPCAMAQDIAGNAQWGDPDPIGELINRVNFAAGPALSDPIDADVGYAPGAARSPERGFAAYTDADIWREGADHRDRLRITTRGQVVRADGAPVPFSSADSSRYEADAYDVRYTRGWSSGPVDTQSGLQVDFTPHAGIGMGSRGGSGLPAWER